MPLTGEVKCDRESKFSRGLDEELADAGCSAFRLPHAAPNLNAYAERFIQTIHTECLDRFIIPGLHHLRVLHPTQTALGDPVHGADQA